MPSNSVPDDGKKPKVYYSARGGSRSKGADSTARANVASLPSPTGLEVPLPRSTTTHFSRGGQGNEWTYGVEDSVSQKALEHDELRVQELRWKTHDHRIAKTGLRGGALIPKKKEPKLKDKDKTGRFAFLKKRKDSMTTSETGESSTTSPTSSAKSLEQRLYEMSIASSDDTQSIALSNFTAPTFMLAEAENESGNDSGTTEPGVVDATAARARSFSLSPTPSEDSLGTPEVSPTGHG